MSFSAQDMYAKLKAETEAKATADGAAPSSGAPAPADNHVPLVSVKTIVPPAEPVLVLFGSVNYAEMAKKESDPDAPPNLLGPHRLGKGLSGIKLAYIATGCTSAHVVALGADGETFTWGRNDAGQLGHGDMITRPGPERVSALTGKAISSAATGKAHTVFVARNGSVHCCGAAKQGCVGSNVGKKAETQTTPVNVPGLPAIAAVACGANFNLACDSDGDAWAWGWSEFGVLGNGTDGEHNTKDSSLKLSYNAQSTPQRILKLMGQRVVRVACGTAHCVAVTDEGVVFTWGSGGYGRLGHREQKDLWVPTALPDMRAAEVSCGSMHTAALGWPLLRSGAVCTGAPALYMWGRVKAASQNAWMYPKTEDELRGWAVHSIACGAAHNVVHADSSAISWGSGCSSGELGFGENGKKSSARPDKIETLEGVSIAQIACGLANSMLLVEDSEQVRKLPEWVPKDRPAVATKDASKGKDTGKSASKRKAPEPARGKKASKKK